MIVEGSELVDESGPRADLIERIRAGFDVERLLFELPWPGVGGATPERVEAVKRLLVRTFGPDVNLGNVPPEQIVATELVRLGLEDPASWPAA